MADELPPLDAGTNAPRLTIVSRGRFAVIGTGKTAEEITDRLSTFGPASLVETGRGARIRLTGSFGNFRVETSSHASAVDADIVLDLTGGPSLVRGCDDCDGYIRANPLDEEEIARATAQASSLIGTFEKPIHAAVDPLLCAHQRNGKVGCTRCLDRCPAGAIAPRGDAAFINPSRCEGCGACAAACPTGAVSYFGARVRDFVHSVRSGTVGSQRDDVRAPALLLYEPGHGGPLLSAYRDLGIELPRHLLRLSVPSVAAVGHDQLLAAIAAGYAAVVVLVPARHRASYATINAEAELATAILGMAGHSNPFVILHGVQDPDELVAALAALPSERGPVIADDSFGPTKRASMRLLLRSLATPAVAVLALESGAPYGAIALDGTRCTMCFACASVCPTSALQDTPDRPALRFTERTCIQCGLCVATCPEEALKLLPRLNFSADADMPVILNEEPVALCRRCGCTIGTHSTIRRVRALLEGNPHFKDESRLDLIEMCADCRVISQFESNNEPFATRPRPLPRTSDDYLS